MVRFSLYTKYIKKTWGHYERDFGKSTGKRDVYKRQLQNIQWDERLEKRGTVR